MTLHEEMLADMAVIRYDTGSPTFIWYGVSYPCIASISTFNRDLVDGGFTMEQLLTLTVPRYDSGGSPTFSNDVLPQPQQRLTYGTKLFRIETVSNDSVANYDSSGTAINNGARVRIVAIGLVRGI